MAGTRTVRRSDASEIHDAGGRAYRRMLAYVGEAPAPRRPDRTLSDAERAEARHLSARLWAGVAEREARADASAQPSRIYGADRPAGGWYARRDEFGAVSLSLSLSLSC